MATHSSILAWRIPCTVYVIHGVTKSRPQWSNFHFTSLYFVIQTGKGKIIFFFSPQVRGWVQDCYSVKNMIFKRNCDSIRNIYLPISQLLTQEVLRPLESPE